MKKQFEYRPRLSIVLPEELFNQLNEEIGVHGLKNQLFVSLVKQLVTVMRKMNRHQKNVLIAAIIEEKIGMKEWSKTVREATK